MDERQYIDIMWNYAKESGRNFSCEITADGNITISLDAPTERTTTSTYQEKPKEAMR